MSESHPWKRLWKQLWKRLKIYTSISCFARVRELEPRRSLRTKFYGAKKSLKREQNPKQPDEHEEQKPLPVIEIPALSLEELKVKTNNFGSEALIAKCSYGGLYSVTLDTGKTVAIKKLDDSSSQSNFEFLTQEVDEYYEFYKAKMEQTGYASIYVQRTGQKRDGCGVFYKNDVAELVLHETIDYNDLVNTIISGSDLQADSSTCSLDRDGTPAAKTGTPAEKTKDSMQGSAKVGHGDPNDPRVRLKRDCVGILAAFQLQDPSRQVVIIANTHIYWDPEWVDVKLAQVKYLLSRLSLFKSLVSEKFDCTPSVLVAGDFNSIPGDQVYQYLVSGGPSAIPPVQCEDELLIPLLSVYAHTRGEPTFTNCTPGFTGTLDYIFFSPSGCIKPISFLELPEADSSSVEGGLPNHHHPSDHLPIGAEFEVISG